MPGHGEIGTPSPALGREFIPLSHSHWSPETKGGARGMKNGNITNTLLWEASQAWGPGIPVQARGIHGLVPSHFDWMSPGVDIVGGIWHKASIFGCLPLAVPIGLSQLLVPALCGSGRVLVVSTEPPDDLSCLTTLGVGCPGDGLLLTKCIQTHTPSPCGGSPTPALTGARWGGHLQDHFFFVTGASNHHI